MILKQTISFIGKNVASKKNLTIDDLLINKVSAEYILKGDKVFLIKIKDDKIVEEVYIGKIWWWDKIHKYATDKYINPKNPLEYKGCPTSCGLCSNHKNPTALLNIVVTNRCDLQCPYCFFYSERVGYVYEPSLDQIIQMIDSANRFYKIRAVQLTGGEPLLRKDLPEIIRAIKNKGVRHIQLNTNLVQLGIEFYYRPLNAAEFAKNLKEAGLNTIYASFDGTTPKTNPKNHYELPFALEALRKGNIRSVVLVPTLINGQNFPNEVDKIILFAAKNREIIRGVNFQPVSFVGYMKKEEVEQVEKLRVTISDLIETIEKKLNIPKEAWYPIPTVVPFLKLLGKEDLGFYNNPICGMATYVFYHEGKFYPITSFIDVDKLYNDAKRIKNVLDKFAIIFKLLLTNRYFLQKELPDGTNLKKLIVSLVLKKGYKEAGDIHYKFLFLGTMHFMDPFNYDLQRVQRCCIHYASSDGRVIPFCTYNVFPQIYRDSMLRKYSLPEEEAKKLLEENKEYYKRVAEFRSNIKEIINHPIYKKYYL